MSRATAFAEGRALVDKLQCAMDAAWSENRVERVLRLKDAQGDIYNALGRGVALEVFESFEPEYVAGARAIDVELPAAMSRARTLLGGAL